MMHYEDAAVCIPRNSTGVYIAYPTSAQFKPIYRGYKTVVNLEHTKIGIAQRSFESREHGYIAAFQSEVKFFPVLELPATQLLPAALRFGFLGHVNEGPTEM
jgi:hypothetical protein